MSVESSMWKNQLDLQGDLRHSKISVNNSLGLQGRSQTRTVKKGPGLTDGIFAVGLCVTCCCFACSPYGDLKMNIGCILVLVVYCQVMSSSGQIQATEANAASNQLDLQGVNIRWLNLAGVTGGIAEQDCEQPAGLTGGEHPLSQLSWTHRGGCRARLWAISWTYRGDFPWE